MTSDTGQLSSPLQALHRYQHLAALISGEEPRNLLQPAGQRRYLAQRIEELAQGTCVREFAWNSGGSFDGRPWSAELPSDADLVFYLVAAYMEVGVGLVQQQQRLQATVPSCHSISLDWPHAWSSLMKCPWGGQPAPDQTHPDHPLC